MNKKYIVRLTEPERTQLDALIRKGTAAAAQIKHAHLLLKADAAGAGWRDEEIAAAFSVPPPHRCRHAGTLRGARLGGRPAPQKAGAPIPSAAL